jgi:hypothetical protein
VPFVGALNANAFKNGFILPATCKRAGKMGRDADITTQITGGKVSRGRGRGKA